MGLRFLRGPIYIAIGHSLSLQGQCLGAGSFLRGYVAPPAFSADINLRQN